MRKIIFFSVILLTLNNFSVKAQKGFRVYENSKKNVGIIDKTGAIVIPVEYDKISYINTSYECQKSGLKGVFSAAGDILVPIIYDSLVYSNCSKPTFYGASKAGKWILFNGEGKKLTKLKYDRISLPNGNKMGLSLDAKYLTLDISNGALNRISKEQFDAYEFEGEICLDLLMSDGAIIKQLTREGGLYGYKKDGEWLIKPEYQSLKNTVSGFWIGRKQGKYGLISSEGKELTEFVYSETSTLFNYVILRKEGKYGVFDVQEERLLIPIQYDKIEFIE